MTSSSEIFDSIRSLQEHLYRFGIKKADDRLDCSLFLLFSIHKQIPFVEPDRAPKWEVDKEKDDEIYEELYLYTEPFIQDPRHYYILRDEYERFSHIDRDEFESLYPQALSFLFQYTYIRYGRLASEYWQPSGLSTIIADILNQHGVRSVYNPFAGTASIIGRLNKDIRYVGQEIENSQALRASILIEAHKAENAIIRRGDSFLEWERGPFDAIYANMPWGIKVSAEGNRKESSETYFLKRASEESVLSVGIYPVGILFKGGSEGTIRRTLVDRGDIETVILLPTKLFANTGISTCIIVTNRASHRFGEIQFIDATKLVHTNHNTRGTLDIPTILPLLQQQHDSEYVHWVSCDTIRNNEYNLLIAKKSGKKLVVPEGYKLHKLSELCTTLHNRAKEAGEGHIIRMTNLANSPDDILRTAEDFPIEHFNKGCDFVDRDALLIGTVARLKPTHFSFQGEKAYIKSNVLALSVNEEMISIPYLVGELNKEYVKDQLFTEGSYVSHISTRNILDLSVMVPSKARQEAEVSARLSSIKKEGEKALADEAAAFKAEVHNRKHDIMTHVQNFKAGLDLLSIYNAQITDHHLSEDISDTIAEMRSAYRLMYEQLEHFADDDEFGTPTNLDLVTALAKQVGISGNCEIRFVPDEAQIPPKTKALVHIASVDFNRLLTNIIGNAKRHAFTDESRKDYEILIRLTADRKKDLYIIDFCNNGKPFPANIDKFKYGIDGEKAGPNAGSGKGGSRVKKICQHYHGDYDLGSFEENGYLWSYVRIMLPIQ